MTKKRMILSTLIIMIILNIIPISMLANENELYINFEGDIKYSMTLNIGEEKELLAFNKLDKDLDYQWQYLQEDQWYDFQDEINYNFLLSFDKVKDYHLNDKILIRVVAKNDGGLMASESLNVTIIDESYDDIIETKKDQDIIIKENIKEDYDKIETFNDGDGNVIDVTTYTITIKYVFENDENILIAPEFKAVVPEGKEFSQEVKSPEIQGYNPEREIVSLKYQNVSNNDTVIVKYSAADVNYKVRHHLQNINDDKYTLDEEQVFTGKTGTTVVGNLVKNYSGFTPVPFGSSKEVYDKNLKISADGKTQIDIYYDRNYYFMDFDLNGGFGVEPIYDRFEQTIIIEEPKKAGYDFLGWSLDGSIVDIPNKMPSKDIKYSANFVTKGLVDFQVVYWAENANDENYSVWYMSEGLQARPGYSITSNYYFDEFKQKRENNEHFNFNKSKSEERKEVLADGTTVLNLYYDRKKYTLDFRTCGLFEIICRKVYSIESKYGSDIRGEFSELFKTHENYAWKSSYFKEVIKALDVMPGSNILFTGVSRGSSKTINYYTESLTNGERQFDGKNFDKYKVIKHDFKKLTENEEFHDIEGFSKYKAEPSFKNGDAQIGANNINNLYYLRNSHKVIFKNYNKFLSNENIVKYNDVIKLPSDVPYPKDLAPEGYEFKGWCTVDSCISGSEFDTKTKMPDNDLILYANWKKKKHNVQVKIDNILLDKDILHGDFIEAHDIPVNPTKDNYRFVGWFYKDKNDPNSILKPFSFSMPINKSIIVEPGWTSNVIKQYQIKYVTTENGNKVDVAEPSQLLNIPAGQSRTVTAKNNSELYDNYKGYFSKQLSKSVTVGIDDDVQIVEFEYVKEKETTYTVKYLGENDIALHPAKTVTTSNNVVTEIYKFIDGWTPIKFIQTVNMSNLTDSNLEIIFRYNKTPQAKAPLIVNYYEEKLDGTYIKNEIKEIILEVDIDINVDLSNYINKYISEGFKFNEAKTTANNIYELNTSIPMPKDGISLDIYHSRKIYDYVFNFVDISKDQHVSLGVESGQAKFGETITINAKEFLGYSLAEGEVARKDIVINTGDNIGFFNYKEDTVTINYEAVGEGSLKFDGENVGSKNLSETVSIKTGTAKGVIPEADEGHIFIGWCKVKDCQGSTITENDGSIDPLTNKFTPKQQDTEGTELYKETTYYANFAKNVTKLKIIKTGVSDSINQSFIYNVKKKDSQEDILRLVINLEANIDNGYMTITDLEPGDYIVEEESEWSWRYNKNATQEVTLTYEKRDTEVIFSSGKKTNKWLSGDNWDSNIFDIFKPH